jgi:predicted peptidase
MRKLASISIVLMLASSALWAQTPAKVAANPKDPLYQSKGDQHRAYLFPDGNGVIVPYRLFVPSKWTKDQKFPMMVILHSGNSVDVPFERGNAVLAKVAEQRGYIVLSPQGYGPSPRYNTPYQVIPANGPLPVYQRDPRSEQDVMNVTELVAQEYNVDRNRIYLFSNSHGAAGAWYLGEKYPQVWASIGVASGAISPDKYPFDHLKNVGLLIVHGDKDDTMSFAAAEKMAQAAKQHGLVTEWMPVKDGDHLEAWTKVFPQMLDFFDKHPKK